MGYYIEIIKSDAFIPVDRLEICYQKMCSLNETHDYKKIGGSWSNGKQNAKWFSWMAPNYPEICKDAQAILQKLGFETEYNSHGDLLIIGYDNKMGQEELFLTSIQNDAVGSIKWRGEDDKEWSTNFFGDNVIEASSTKKQLPNTKKTLAIQ